MQKIGMRVWFILSLWLVGGCRYQAPDLPALTTLQQLAEMPLAYQGYPLTREGDWLHAIACSEKMVQQGEQILDRETQVWFTLLLPTVPGVLLPTLQDHEQQRSVLHDAVRHSAFAEMVLSREQLDIVAMSWRDLAYIERRFLEAGVVVAELRQKWQDTVHASCQPAWCWSRLHRRMASLPSLMVIERQRLHCQVLLNACRQLIMCNPSLMPPLEQL